jgi:hypothetical protein
MGFSDELPSDDNNKNKNGFEIYPNPAVSEILISGMSSLSKNEVSIVDMQGRKVITEKNVCENKKIDVSSLTKGIYMINVITDGGIFSQKMIKQ